MGYIIMMTSILQKRKSRLKSLKQLTKSREFKTGSSQLLIIFIWDPTFPSLTVPSLSSIFLWPCALLAYLIDHFVLLTLCVTPARWPMHELTRTHHLWTNWKVMMGFSGPAAGRSKWDSRQAGPKYIFQIITHGQTATQLPYETAESYCVLIQA